MRKTLDVPVRGGFVTDSWRIRGVPVADKHEMLLKFRSVFMTTRTNILTFETIFTRTVYETIIFKNIKAQMGEI